VAFVTIGFWSRCYYKLRRSINERGGRKSINITSQGLKKVEENRMRKIFSIGIMGMMVLMTFALIGGNVSAATVEYPNNRPGWEAAVLSYDEEFFTDVVLNPGVTVTTTYPGYVDIVKGVWWDRLVVPASGETTTTWHFATPIIGFGGYWDTAGPGGPGASIEVEYDGSWTTVGEIPATYTGQFWGFVSDTPFSNVRLSSGSTPGAWCETYELDNMVYATTWNVDQQQTQDFHFAGCYDKYWHGQSFKPGLPTLTGVKLYIMKSGAPPNPAVLSVRSHLNGPDLTSIALPAAAFPISWDWVAFDLPDIPVTPGNTYYLVLRTVGGTIHNSYIWSYGLVTPYTSGELWKSYNYGLWGSWVMCSWYDFCFKTYGY
jgi:hypothetical protein